jgi:hypothetical protein
MTNLLIIRMPSSRMIPAKPVATERPGEISYKP